MFYSSWRFRAVRVVRYGSTFRFDRLRTDGDVPGLKEDDHLRWVVVRTRGDFSLGPRCTFF